MSGRAEPALARRPGRRGEAAAAVVVVPGRATRGRAGRRNAAAGDLNFLPEET